MSTAASDNFAAPPISPSRVTTFTPNPKYYGAYSPRRGEGEDQYGQIRAVHRFEHQGIFSSHDGSPTIVSEMDGWHAKKKRIALEKGNEEEGVPHIWGRKYEKPVEGDEDWGWVGRWRTPSPIYGKKWDDSDTLREHPVQGMHTKQEMQTYWTMYECYLRIALGGFLGLLPERVAAAVPQAVRDMAPEEYTPIDASFDLAHCPPSPPPPSQPRQQPQRSWWSRALRRAPPPEPPPEKPKLQWAPMHGMAEDQAVEDPANNDPYRLVKDGLPICTVRMTQESPELCRVTYRTRVPKGYWTFRIRGGREFGPGLACHPDGVAQGQFAETGYVTLRGEESLCGRTLEVARRHIFAGWSEAGGEERRAADVVYSGVIKC